MNKLNVQNLQSFLGWLFPLNVSIFLWKNSSFSYYKYDNNFSPRFLFNSFSQKKNGKMQLKCRVQKIKVESRSKQNKSLANTFDRNFDQARSESLISRAVFYVFWVRSIKFVCNSKLRLKVKPTISAYYSINVYYKDTILQQWTIISNLKIFARKQSYSCNSNKHLKKVLNVY